MRTILLALAFCAALGAQITTTVTDTLVDARNRPVSGLIQLDWDAFTTLAGVFIPSGRAYVPVVKGLFAVALSPNDTASPSGNYTATYAILNYRRNAETWRVCTSMTPVSLASVTGVVFCTGDLSHTPSWAATTSTTWQAITSTTWAALTI